MGFTLVCPSLPFHLPVSLPYSFLPPFLVFILSYMSLPCYSPSFNCPLFLSLICLQCLPNFVIPYFLSLEFHSPNFSPRFLSLNSSSPSLPPKCLFLNFLSHEFHFHNFSPRNLFLSDDDLYLFPTEINEKTTDFLNIGLWYSPHFPHTFTFPQISS